MVRLASLTGYLESTNMVAPRGSGSDGVAIGVNAPEVASTLNPRPAVPEVS
jgi:hypothetical protein